MSDEEPRLDLAGNPLPPKVSAPPAPTYSAPTPGYSAPAPSYAPPSLQPIGGPPPLGGPRPAYTPGFEPVEPNSNGLKIGLGIGGVLLLLIIGLVVALTPRHAAVPTAYTTFASADKSFTCDAPSGWAVTASGGGKMSDGSEATVGGVLFQSNSATIDVTTDTYATLMAYDIMNNNGDPQSLTGSKASALHKQWRKRVGAEHKGYHETQIANYDSPTGDGRLAEWTAAGNPLGFYGPQHGYRASLDGGGKTIVVICSCLESDWPAMKPAFQHVLASFHGGGMEETAPGMPGAP